MNNKTIEHAAAVLREIKAETRNGVVKSTEIPMLVDLDTSEEIGFVVILTLSAKFDYTNTMLNKWRERLLADECIISVKFNQLVLKFYVHFSEAD